MFAAILLMTSCSKRIIPDIEMPIAINTINSVGLRELNLKHGTDYTILNTVSADATVIYSVQKKGKQITIREENGEFKIVWKRDEESGKMYRDDYEGIARFGFLNDNYYRVSTREIEPANIVSNLARYRLINLAKVRGADGIIEPVVSTNVEDRGNDIVFRTTISAKLMKLTPDSK